MSAQRTANGQADSEPTPSELPSPPAASETRSSNPVDAISDSGVRQAGGQLALPTPSWEDLQASIRQTTGMPADAGVLRNLRITQTYAQLSGLLAQGIGRGNANWSTFATWASKTAGRSIRGEDIPILADLLRAQVDVGRHLGRLRMKSRVKAQLDADPFDLARAIVAEVSRQISAGNLKVFAELAPLFSQFWNLLQGPPEGIPSAFAEFHDRLRPGPPEKDGQELLKTAFTSYYRAASEPSSKRRAELTLYGNLLIGLHEQTRLQENIAGALDAPFSKQVYDEFGASVPQWLQPVVLWLLKWWTKLFARDFQRVWQRLATRLLMKLTGPGGEEIELGEDLPPRQFEFPPELQTLEDPPLQQLINKYDKNPASTKGSAAANWTVLADRMGFLCDLFRAAQQQVRWFEQPFSEAQRAAIDHGELPQPPL